MGNHLGQGCGQSTIALSFSYSSRSSYSRLTRYFSVDTTPEACFGCGTFGYFLRENSNLETMVPSVESVSPISVVISWWF